MSTIKVTEDGLLTWVDKLIAQQRVVGVQQKGRRFVYDTLESSAELRLDHDVTTLPPGKFFLPQTEELIAFGTEGKVSSNASLDRFILLGVHPYDVVAIRQMDAVFGSGNTDVHYMQRRRSATIIACDVQTPSPHVFAGYMGTATVHEGFDVLLTKIVSGYVVDAATPRGEALLTLFCEGATAVSEDDLNDRCEVWQHNNDALKEQKLNVMPEQWPDLLKASYDDDIWKEQAQYCFSCGGCNLVCGTCSCFDIQDTLNWNLQEGTRNRVCDTCMISGFMKVAGGHDFQAKPFERYRHRFFRKGSYMPQRFGFTACTGCGRCADACISDIANPVALYNQLYERHRDALKPTTPAATSSPVLLTRPKPTSVFSLYPPTVPDASNDAYRTDLYLPELATLVQSYPVTALETYYEFRLDSGRLLGHQPGQFVMVSMTGFGEAPFSITSSPNKVGTFEMVIRSVGTVTNAMKTLNPGDKVGVRGPFGTSFPVYDALVGKDVLVVSGGLGIVPVRSAIDFMIENRSDYGRISIAYGMKSPAEKLFGIEIEKWRLEPDVTVLETVDNADATWKGTVGPVTKLLPSISIQPERTAVIICGPPVMYKFVLKELFAMGIAEDNIYASLERRMKCGIGKCGHCQINDKYVCREGPVFRYTDLVSLQEAL